MEELSLDNIMLDDEIDTLFEDNIESTENQTTEEESSEEKDKTEATEVDADELFAEPEGVGSGNNQAGEDTDSTKKSGTSPKNNFYSSIAKAFKEDGVFPDLDDEVIKEVKDAESFAKCVEDLVSAKFDERQKRIDDALNAGVEPSVIKQHENTIAYLNNLSETDITEETEDAEMLRKQLIFQDLINRGYSKEQATRKLQKSIDSGNDIDDAKEALESNKEYYSKSYTKLVEDAKKEAEEEKVKVEKESAALKKSILEDSKVFGELSVDKQTRQKIYDSISKPTYKDKDTGNYMTAIQKYQMENPVDFRKYVGLFYTLTDGFKNIDSLVKNKVKKEINKNLRDLENTLNNTQRTSDGNLRFVSGVGGDSESYLGKNWDIDI